MNELSTRITDYLRARRRVNMIAEEAAWQLGISTTYLSKIERGHRNPKARVVWLMAKIYGAPQLVDVYCNRCDIKRSEQKEKTAANAA